MTTINIFDALIFIGGIYMAVSGILMKTQKKINKTLVLSRNTTEDSIRDKEGFIDYIWLKLTLIGIMCALSGVINIIISRYEGSAVMIASLVCNGIFLLLVVAYGILVVKAQKRFSK